MTERNKIEFALFAKMGVLFLWGILAVITFAGVMNNCPENFVKWCAGILLASNIAIIVGYARRLVRDRLAAIEAIQKKEREELAKSKRK